MRHASWASGDLRIVIDLLSVLIAGVLAGAIYGLISSGLTLEFGVMRVINFAHGFMVMVSMYGYYYLSTEYGISPYLGVLIITPVAIVTGGLIYLFVLYPFVRRGAEPIAIALVTLALALVFQQAMNLIAGARARSVDVSLSLRGLHPFDIYIGVANLVAAGMSAIALVALLALLRWTPWGRYARAVAQDPEAARTLGINPDAISTLAFALGSGLAAVAGAALITILPVSTDDGLTYSLISFVVVVLGGLSSIKGAWIAAILVGVSTNLVGFYWSSAFQSITYLALFLGVLLLRPQGLFGHKGDVGEVRVA
jgi:branched-chain amino acid transport system permease protein